MKENIALIKEVHHKKPREIAEAEAKMLLQELDIAHVADLRSNHCTKEELFYVMILRAMMCDREIIVIKTPLQLLENLANICKIIKSIQKIEIDSSKTIIILDTQANLYHYEECGCPIVK
ncbi:hypothetical protein MNB_SM-7-1218 [hydrothermal vent metagenome]|uniref:Uncharacterized protein n=1 Tax=hydrothermal vent metagenome TaxID=652676 RepID=A0A1W1BF39_9ZZZZ